MIGVPRVRQQWWEPWSVAAYMRTSLVGDNIHPRRLAIPLRSPRLNRAQPFSPFRTQSLPSPLPASLLLRQSLNTQQQSQQQFALSSVAVIHPASPEKRTSHRIQFDVETTLSFSLERRL